MESEYIVKLRKQIKKDFGAFKEFESSRFFQPDDEMVKSIIEYADGRFIIDIGCGDGHFIERLIVNDHFKAVGFDCYSDVILSAQRIFIATGHHPQLLPYEVYDKMCQKLIENFKDKCIVTLCRPCHSEDLIVGTIDVCEKFGVPLLYIGVERNIENDLYMENYEILDFKGSSKDGEKIYLIKT